MQFDGVEWDEAVDEVMKKTHLLDEWGDPQNFPHENKVRAKLAAILGEVEISDDEERNLAKADGRNGVSEAPAEDDSSEDPELEQMKEEQEEKPSHDQDDEDFLKGLLNDE